MNLVTIAQYAKLCKVSRQAIDYRVKKNDIHITLIDVKRKMIDIDKFPA